MLYRIVVEYSCMSNNDERIHYKENPVEAFTLCPNDGRVVISRPVYDIEIEKGLKTENVVGLSMFDEKTPDITSFFDSIYKMKHFVDVFKDIYTDFSVEHIIKHFATQYYDCMSGGLSLYIISILGEISKRDDVDKSIQIYPGKNKEGDEWHTLQDFLDQAKPSSLDDIKNLFQKQIPSINQFLLE